MHANNHFLGYYATSNTENKLRMRSTSYYYDSYSYFFPKGWANRC